VGVGQLGGLQRVAGALGGDLRQARVGHARQQRHRVLRQVAQVLAHLGRAGRAVQPDDVDLQRFQRRQGGADLRAEQHGAGRLDGDLGYQRYAAAVAGHRPVGGDERGLGLQEVLAGLDEDGVDAAREQPLDLGLVGVAQLGERDVPEGGQLGAGADRADDPARPVGRAVVGRDLGREPGPRLGELADAVGDAVLAEVAEVGAEGVGLDRVAAHVEVRRMHAPDDVGPRDVEDLVAALVALEVVEPEVGGLQHGAHRAVGDDDPLAQRCEQVGSAGRRAARRPGGRGHAPNLRGSAGEGRQALPLCETRVVRGVPRRPNGVRPPGGGWRVGSYRTVLVGTDGSESSYRAVDRAAAIAQATGATLVLVSAYRPMPERELRLATDVLRDEAYKVTGATPAEDALRMAADRARAAGASAIEAMAVEGDPVEAILSAADSVGAELVVVGNRGLNSLAGRLLGSVPSSIAHRAECDVLITHTTSGR
jgi:nucleotide-binding universal stress UspA family protein